jgi:ligand-binding SRPBCC domain-containing protein
MLHTTQTPGTIDGIQIRREDRTAWSLTARQQFSLAPTEIFPFFADASNLARLTPPELGFDILTPTPIAMRAGALIDYRIRLWRIPLRWRTAITAWNPPTEFVDVQLRGPYAEWVHRHRFVELAPSRTLVEDVVRFRLPLGLVGALAGPIVRRQLRRIFTYRRDVIAHLEHTEPLAGA